ncbi:Innexin [Aphelenchoides bicaudatus]|nr:Innexin [Aphelenchoides bicaudatus]
MDKIDNFFQYLSKTRFEEDNVDRLFFRTSPRLLVGFALVILTKEYMFNSIECWASPEWVGSWYEYAKDYCFVEGTYYVNIKDPLERMSDRYSHYKNVDYYPWLAFVLALQALICYMPYFVWSSFNHKSGLALKTVNHIANNAAFTKFSLASTDRFRLSEHIYHSLRITRYEPRVGFSSMRNLKRFYRTYFGRHCLVVQYLFMKVMFIVLALIQIKFISSYLGKSTSIWDFARLLETFEGEQTWEKTGSFPRTAFCDFEIRGLERNVEKHTIQCVLMANMINEKLFIAVWWWLWLLVIVGTVNLLNWVHFLFWGNRSKKYTFDAIVHGNESNQRSLNMSMDEKMKEHNKTLHFLKRLTNFLNRSLSGHNTPVNYLDYRQVETDPDLQEGMQECINKYWSFKCDENVKAQFMRFLGADGVLFFRLMELNSSTPVVNELLSQLFHDYISKNLATKKEEEEAKLKKTFKTLPNHFNQFSSGTSN